MKTLLVSTLSLYLVGLFEMLLFLIKNQKFTFGLMLPFLCGFIFHTAAIVERGIEVGRFPFVLPSEVFSFLGWAIAGYFVFGSIWNRNRVMTSYVMPVAFVFTLVATIHPSPVVTPTGFKSF